MAKTIEITEPMRKALAEFGPDSAVFRLRGQIPKNYKDTHNGIPFVLVGGGNGALRISGGDGPVEASSDEQHS